MKTYFGIDVGGTKIELGEVDACGHVLKSKRYRSEYHTMKEAARQILAAVERYKKEEGFIGTLQAGGVGIVGTSDFATGRWLTLYFNPDSDPIPLPSMISSHLNGIPFYIDNDVRSAVTAELMLGCGKHSRNFIYLNVGTGLAAGFVVDGHVLRGSAFEAGEIGHMTVDYKDDLICPVCGRHGCAENVVSGAGFTRQIRRAGMTDLIDPESGMADVAKLMKRAEAGGRQSREIAERGAATLAAVIMNLVRTVDPDTIVYGGGILGNPYFLSLVEERLEPGTMRHVRGGKIIPSTFCTADAGLVGAASLGMAGLQQHASMSKENDAAETKIGRMESA